MLHSYLFENYYIAINSIDYLNPEGKPCFDMGVGRCGCDVAVVMFYIILQSIRIKIILSEDRGVHVNLVYEISD